MADSPLHKSPSGLLARFAMKVLGQAPDRFGGTVLPVVEVGGAYSADLLSIMNVNGTPGLPAAASARIPITVPTIVRAINASYNPGATPDDTRFFIECRLSATSGGAAVQLFAREHVYTPVPGLIRCGFMLPYPLWLNGGAEIVCSCLTDSTQTDVSVQATAIVELLP